MTVPDDPTALVRPKEEMITGNEIKEIREQLEMSRTLFAQLMGVHLSSVARWEKQVSAPVKVDPLHLRLLLVLQTEVAYREPVELANILVHALATGGTLYGLYELLRHVYEESP